MEAHNARGQDAASGRAARELSRGGSMDGRGGGRGSALCRGLRAGQARRQPHLVPEHAGRI
ncbi:protein of unknown function [Methylocella tundrae]|uniref:Uncharacterized protein n=1 Tax=Methylocella tundrae TaxID=227605 RepID=A0A4V6IMI3_METTU|nr:protein of unknown function [Methylocella tundrae]